MNVLQDPEIRADLPRFSDWPTFPQLFINGEFIGGCDPDQVYTVYVLAAPRIEEDRGTLWEEVGQLQERGRIERFQGLDLVDGAVARLLQRTVNADTIAVSRGAEGVERGEPERFVYADGTTLDSRGEQLHGAAIARAYSAQVQYR